jgi:hypothetical protein
VSLDCRRLEAEVAVVLDFLPTVIGIGRPRGSLVPVADFTVNRRRSRSSSVAAGSDVLSAVMT